MAKQTGFVIRLQIEGATQTLKAFNDLPKEANQAIRERSWDLAQSLAGKVRGAAEADTAQSALMAPSVKARKDRFPVIVAGGATKVGRKKAPRYGILLGSEFGSNNRSGWYAASKFEGDAARQFRPHRGKNSYWFFKTVYDSQAEISAAWTSAADDIVKAWSSGGGS